MYGLFFIFPVEFKKDELRSDDKKFKFIKLKAQIKSNLEINIPEDVANYLTDNCQDYCVVVD